MPYFGLYVQLRRGSVAGYTTDERWAYRPKEGVEAFESITFFIRFIYAINYEHLLIVNEYTFLQKKPHGANILQDSRYMNVHECFHAQSTTALAVVWPHIEDTPCQ
jgi:hypothetical protein